MSQNQNCGCGCNDEVQTVKLPIRGIGFPCHGMTLDVDSSVLKNCDCEFHAGCRIRVKEDLHVYVDGKRSDSGDGLTPDTAVASFNAAIDVVARHDGVNKYKAIIHFATLQDGSYPVINIEGCSHVTFTSISILGSSYQETKFEKINCYDGSVVDISNITCGSITAKFSRVTIQQNLALNGGGIGIYAANSSCVMINNAVIFSIANSYSAMIFSHSQSYIEIENTQFILNNPAMSSAFARTYAGSINFVANTTFTGSATGPRYICRTCGTIEVHGKGASYIPGSQAGFVEYGGVYVP